MEVEINAVQALKLLNKTKNPLLVRARYEAIELCKKKKDGTTHTREVRDVMKMKGVIEDIADDRWMGALFNTDFFEDTGETVAVADDERNIHGGRDVKLWRLKELYRKITLPEPGALPPVKKKVRLGRMDQLLRDVQMRVGESALTIRCSSLLEKDQPQEGETLITIQYRRRYPDALSDVRTISGESLERTLNKVIEYEDEQDQNYKRGAQP